MVISSILAHHTAWQGPFEQGSFAFRLGARFGNSFDRRRFRGLLVGCPGLDCHHSADF
jgi:hypothetical protein